MNRLIYKIEKKLKQMLIGAFLMLVLFVAGDAYAETVPERPANVQVTFPSYDVARITWDDCSNETSYRVECYNDRSIYCAPYQDQYGRTQIRDFVYVTGTEVGLPDLPANTTSVDFKIPEHYGRYIYFRVSAINSAGSSESTISSLKLLDSGEWGTITAMPLSGTEVVIHASVDPNFYREDETQQLASYGTCYLYRDGVQINVYYNSYCQNHLEFIDRNAVPGHSYTYTFIQKWIRITQDTATEFKVFSPNTSVTVRTPVNLPPNRLSVFADYDIKKLTIAWNELSVNEAGFIIEATETPETGNWSPIKRLDACSGINNYITTDYDISGHSEGSRYWYRVGVLYNGRDPVYGKLGFSSIPPNAPTDLRLVRIGDISDDPLSAPHFESVTLEWTDNSNVETRYELFRDDCEYITSINASQTTYTHVATTLPNKRYVYSVVAVDKWGVRSKASSLTIDTPLLPPYMLGIADQWELYGENFVTLKWKANGIINKDFTIQRSTDNSNWATVLNVIHLDNITGYFTWQDRILSSGQLYYYRIMSNSHDANGQYIHSGYAYFPVVISRPAGRMYTPYRFQATGISDSAIKLTWKLVAAPSCETDYVIKRRGPNESDFTVIATVPKGTTEYNDTGLLTGAVYDYRIACRYHFYESDEYDDTTGSTWSLPAQDMPPSELAASGVTNRQVSLCWRDNSLHETGYKIERSDEGGAWHEVATVQAAGMQVGFVDYTDNTLSEYVSYKYRVSAVQAGLEGYTNEVQVKTALNPPSGLAGSNITECSILLSWTDASNKELGYVIEQSKDNQTWDVSITAAGANTKSYLVNNLLDGSVYYFRVYAYGPDGVRSECSSVYSAQTVLNDPYNLRFAATSSISKDLAWDHVSSGQWVSYKIERKEAGGEFVQIGTTLEKSYSDVFYNGGLNPQPGKTYSYRVKACTPSLGSGYSNVVSFQQYVAKPPKPTDVTAELVEGTRVQLSWHDQCDKETGFVVQRKSRNNWTTVETEWADIATLSANVLSFTDEDPFSENNTYYYRVYTCINEVWSDPSATASIEMPILYPAPVFVETPTYENKIVLKWTFSGTKVSWFDIGCTHDGSSTLVSFVDGNEREYVIYNVPEGYQAVYSIKAVDRDGDHRDSPFAFMSKCTAFSGPANLEFVSQHYNAKGNLVLRLKWEDNSSSEDGFHLFSPNYPMPIGQAPKNATEADFEIYSPNYGVNKYLSLKAYINQQEDWPYPFYSEEAGVNVTILPPPPLHPTCQALSYSSIKIAWWPPYQLPENKVILERGTGVYPNITWQEVTTITNAVDYIDNGLSSETLYYYRLKRHLNAENLDSEYTSIITAKTLSDDVVAAPTELNVYPFERSTLTLTWKDNADNETGYRIKERYETWDWETGTVISWETVVDDLPPNTTMYKQRPVAGSRVYRVYAYLDKGDYEIESYVEGEGIGYWYVLEGAPSNLTARVESSSDKDTVYLEWTDNCSREDCFWLDVSIDGVNYKPVDTMIPPNTTTFCDENAPQGTKCYYRVRAYKPSDPMANNAESYSEYSNVATAITGWSAPENVTSHPELTSIKLTWENPEGSAADGFNVYKGMSQDGEFILAASILMPVQEYSETDLIPDTTYYYKIYGVKDGHESLDYALCSTSTLKTIPEMPSNLRLSYKSKYYISLLWDDNSVNEEGFRIETSTVDTFPEDNTTITDIYVSDEGSDGTGTVGGTVSNLEMSTTYYFRVTAYNNGGYSNASNTFCVKTASPAPLAPGNLTATSVSDTSIRFSWKDSLCSYAEQFKIYRAESLSGPYVQIDTVPVVPSNGSTVPYIYTSTGLKQLRKYYYTVSASNETADTQTTTKVNATTQGTVLAPSGLSASSITSGSFYLGWTYNSCYQTGFKIEKSTTNEFLPENTESFNESASSRYRVITGLTRKTTYYFRVCAYSSYMTSEYSPVLEVTTLNTTPFPVTDMSVQTISSSALNVSWKNPANNSADGFYVERCPSGSGTYTRIATINVLGSQSVYTYADTGSDMTPQGLKGDTVYNYQVYAFNDQFTSSALYAYNSTLKNIPAAPVIISAAATSKSNILLKWEDRSNNEEHFVVEMSGTSDFSGTITSTEIIPNYTVLSVNALSKYTKYYFRVRAYNNGGNSEYSDIAEVTTWDDAPGAVTNLSVPASFITKNSVRLYWQYDNTANPNVRFLIEKKKGAGNFITVADKESSARMCDITGLDKNTPYTFQVRAYRYGPALSNSTQKAITTLNAPPNAPSGLALDAENAGMIVLTWTDNSSDETAFEIEKLKSGDESPETITVNSGEIVYIDRDISEGTQYFYKIRAYSSAQGAGYSAYSNEVSVDIGGNRSVSVNINNGDASTTSREAVLNIQLQGWEGSTGIQMSVSTDQTGWSDFESYNSTKTIFLPSGSGIKTVNVKVRDSGSNEVIASDIIQLNEMPKMLMANLNGTGDDDLIIDTGRQSAYITETSGIYIKYENGTWVNLHALNCEGMVKADINNDGLDEIIIDFGAPYGIYAWIPATSSWQFIHNLSPDLMLSGNFDNIGGDDIIVDFGPDVSGPLWIRYDDGSWVQVLCGLSPENMISGNFSRGGTDEVICDFGRLGTYILDSPESWGFIHGEDIKNMTSADTNGDGIKELVADFGSEYGIYCRVRPDEWEKLHCISSICMTPEDHDGDGNEEVVIDFGSPYGIFSYDASAKRYKHIHPLTGYAMTSTDSNKDGKTELVVYFGKEYPLYITDDTAGWNVISEYRPSV